MTSAMRNAYERYLVSAKYDDLYKAYRTPSPRKRAAWDYCKRLMKELDGKNLRIIGFNSMMFSAGFRYEKDGKPVFMYITKGGNKEAEIDD